MSALLLDDIVRKLEDLPSLPAVVMELLSSIDQHDSALMRFWLVVSQHPDVGENPGVVKQLIGQHDNH